MTITYQLKGWLTLSGTKDECDQRAADEVESINENCTAQVEIVAQQEIQDEE